ncbi:hypothetical protein GIB67_015682 [Kingdonia uniflora]|uniref:Glyceraldehyde 3-phosphate dehydrogenase NAD(P) binding domain-containing protein n=1 Tax=Kingdonia uniflora TaxID=39325 RepID=A0A7J7NUJ7_9MAGN|nr:hypothetical protein GIB67_015682 [Kingdonia uniflora]
MNKSQMGSSCNEVSSTQAGLSLESMVNSVLIDRDVYDKHSPQISTLTFFTSSLYIVVLVACFIAATITRRLGRKIYAPRLFGWSSSKWCCSQRCYSLCWTYFLCIGVGFANQAKATLKRIRGTDDVDNEYNDLVLASKASKFIFVQVDVLLTPLTHLPLQASHLLKYDSMLGTFKADVKIVDNETISVDGKTIKVVSSRDPLKLPWAKMGIDIVIEGTGVLVDGPGAGKHIQAGVKKVIITAPAKGADIPAYLIGVNEKDYEHDVADIMRLLGASHRDLRQARAAALNIVPTSIVPTSTGATKAVSLVLPPTKGEA